MKKVITFLATLVFLFTTAEIKATHVMGLDMQWKSLGNDTFNITVVVYRRCTDGAAAMSNSGLTITSDSCTNSYTINAGSPYSYTIEDITPTCGTQIKPCPMSGGSGNSTSQIPSGIEKYVWNYKVYFGGNYSNCCWYKIRWQLCCRNSNITTGYADGDFYADSWLNRCVAGGDHGPEFKNPPIEIRSVGQDVVYNHGVVDEDGDSISYMMVSPSGGAYKSPFSYNYPLTCLGGNNPNTQANPVTGFNLDPINGDLLFRPMQVQITVLKLMVTEWRKDSLGIYKVIGKTPRDMQFSITPSNGNYLPTLSGPFSYDVCAGERLCFQITTEDSNSTDSVKIYWNNGIPGASWTTTNDSVRLAKGTICWTTNLSDARSLPYSFSAKAIDNHCPLIGRSSRSFFINVKPPVKPVISYQNGYLSSTQGTTYQWYFNDSIINGATQQSVQVTQNGFYKVKITTAGGCLMESDSFSLTVGIRKTNRSTDIKISPNPFHEQIIINTPNTGKQLDIKMYDLQGRMVLKQTIDNTLLKNNISTIGLAPGVYFLELLDDKDTVIVKVEKL